MPRASHRPPCWRSRYHKPDKCVRPSARRSVTPILTLTVIHAKERGTPQDREAIDWKLITNLPCHVQGGRDPDAGVVRAAMEN